jgi:glycosyltransferase EpsD
MKKVLFSATVDSHILNFHIPYLKYFKENDYEVHVATNGDEKIPYCDVKHIISFERSPFKINNIKAVKQLRHVIDQNKFDIIHTHTPMGSVVTRLAAIKSRRKNNTRVIYTAHGFHFFKGAPLKNWFLFYPVEKILASYTDNLITINKEDYELAKNRFKTDVRFVAGVGLDTAKLDFKLTSREKTELRKSLNLEKDDFVLIYPAELSLRKRQIWLIESLADLIKSNPKIHLLLPGKDNLNGSCQKLVKNLSIERNIHFLGFRNDVPSLLKISNMSVSTSDQEGLPINIMEAMYTGLPIVATECRGNKDLLVGYKNGSLIAINDKDKFKELITKNNVIRYGLSNK